MVAGEREKEEHGDFFIGLFEKVTKGQAKAPACLTQAAKMFHTEPCQIRAMEGRGPL